MAALFAIALFASAALLFIVQPMVAKLVLPLLGGTPAVWNTCMVFFQAVLLIGYAYAHAAPRWLGVRRQAILQLVLLALPIFVLPLGLREGWLPPASANPIPWLLAFLAVTVGLPFFVLSTNTPLLQKWFADTGHPSARDPYFLYAASNLGSMLVLLSYPLLVEPAIPLTTQRLYWSIGYGIMAVLVGCCAVALWRAPRPSIGGSQEKTRADTISGRPGLGTRLRWTALAFVPSSLMLSVTSYLTSEIAPVPLLWVIPLALYLLSFILVFSRTTLVPHRFLVRIMPLSVLALAVVMISLILEPIQLLIPLHLLVFFVIALVCHGDLAVHRPEARHLTEFYLWMALGGVLGGLFNAVVAPLIFTTVVEYPLVLVGACLLRPSLGNEKQETERRTLQRGGVPSRAAARKSEDASLFTRVTPRPLLLDLLVAGLIGVSVLGLYSLVGQSSQNADPHSLRTVSMVGALACCLFLARPIRFSLALGALFLAGGYYVESHRSTVHRERSFFGMHRISMQKEGNLVTLLHGNTRHGRQSLDPGRRHRPLAYYHPTGPVGKVFKEFSGPRAKKEVAIIGLGAGSIAAYGEAGQHFVYYEIDPAVERMARDYFTFLADSRAQIDVQLGDARLTLRQAADKQFDMIIVDAFNSDSIPLHLLTREAFQLYKSKLADNGIMAFHISTEYLDLEPVLGDLASDAGLVCWFTNDDRLTPADEAEGKSVSQWMVMARTQSDFGALTNDRRWERVTGRSGTRVWTDDYSNVFAVFRWD
jgi:hypothetical protein